MLALLAAITLAPLRASAGTPEDQKKSRQFFDEADELAKQGRWKDACLLFQTAHDLNATNGTAYRTAECYEHTDQDERALRLFRYVVEHAATDKVPERVLLAQQHMADLEQKIARAKAAKQAPVGQGPVVQAPVGPPKGPPPPPKPNRVPALVAFGVGGVGAVLGGVFGGLALAQAGDIKTTCGTAPPHCGGYATQAAFESDVSSMHAKAWVSNIGIGVAVAGVATGAVLFALGYPKTATRVTSAVGPGGLTLQF